MIEYRMEHVFSFSGALAAPEVIGPVPEGIRVNFYVTSGEFSGPDCKGTLRAAGGDWITIRRDGVAVLDVRLTFETHDGALILVTYPGVADFGEDGYEKFLRGELPAKLPLRISPRFATAHPAYQWMNRLFCVGIGEFDGATNVARYDVYAVR